MNLELAFLLITVTPFTLTSAAHIQLLDISPEEAQRYITQQSLDLRYARKLSEGSATGQSYNGKVVDSDDYVEEVYDANQFHGQDGLGRFIFGYGDNQQARLEARNVNGEVRGQYRYLDPRGNDVEVQYWSDSLGFHQTDNRPQYDLIPVTETPEVRQAREEHERAWKEAARNNGIDVDSNGLYHDAAYDDLEGQLSSQNLVRFPTLPYTKHLSSENAESFGQVDDDSVTVDADEESHARFARQFDDDRDNVEDATSEPRGFFYSFDYPVRYIADRRALFGEQEPQANTLVETFSHHESDNKVQREAKPGKRKQRNSQRIIEEEPRRDTLPIEDEVNDGQQQQLVKQNLSRSIKNSRGSIKFKDTI